MYRTSYRGRFFRTAIPLLLLTACGAPAVVVQNQGNGTLAGVFYGVEGLDYQTETLSGRTNAAGEFRYRSGEVVTFSVSKLTLGSTAGSQELTTVAHLVLGVNGDVTKIKNLGATNRARFLQSLDDDGNVENGVRITDRARQLTDRYRNSINFGLSEENFSSDASVKFLFQELGAGLRSPAEARNHLRRTLYGIRKSSDVRIPMRDGGYVLADSYRPIAEGRYPAIVGIGDYGKAPYRGCICNQEEMLESAVTEDRFFEGNPDLHAYENHETADSKYWVPNGYAVVRIDGRGVCQVPGVMNPYSAQEAEDFYDAIEWVADREWSNGNVGTWGASYFGINQPIVASLQPPSLKAMVVSAGDSDRYRQVVFTGGIPNTLTRERWWENSVKPNQCYGQPTQQTFDRIALLRDNPFEDSAYYGTYYDEPQPPGAIAADMSKVTVPMLVEVPLSHSGNQHVRGSVITYMDAASEEKQLSLITGNFIAGWMYSEPALAHHLEFYNRWLKGEQNDVMEKPPVKMMVRTGGGGWYWQFENEFPIARTEYRKYYLDGTPQALSGDANRDDFMTLSRTEPSREASRSYSAEVNIDAEACWASGVSFVTDPLAEDMVLAGWLKLVTWVSSTSSDMDLYASVRVLDEDGKEVSYALRPGSVSYPVGKGALKVSHRKLDEARSTIYAPYHTHQESDYAPLRGNDEAVEVEVEIEPTTALVKAGHRIRLDVQPVDGCGWGSPHVYDHSYHDEASNTVYMGPDYRSYVQFPVVPPKR